MSETVRLWKSRVTPVFRRASEGTRAVKPHVIVVDGGPLSAAKVRTHQDVIGVLGVSL